MHTPAYTHSHTRTHTSLFGLTLEDRGLSKWSTGHNPDSPHQHALDYWEELGKSDSISLTSVRKYPVRPAGEGGCSRGGEEEWGLEWWLSFLEKEAHWSAKGGLCSSVSPLSPGIERRSKGFWVPKEPQRYPNAGSPGLVLTSPIPAG